MCTKCLQFIFFVLSVNTAPIMVSNCINGIRIILLQILSMALVIYFLKKFGTPWNPLKTIKREKHFLIWHVGYQTRVKLCGEFVLEDNFFFLNVDFSFQKVKFRDLFYINYIYMLDSVQVLIVLCGTKIMLVLRGLIWDRQSEVYLK